MNNLYKIKQLDVKLRKAQAFRKILRPKNGWISVIRTTLDMSREQLGKRLGLQRDTIQKIEQSEMAHTITMKTLEKAAEAMGCSVYYILLPKEKSLVNFISTQAKKIAREVVSNSAKHMVLENQSATQKIEEQVELIAEELLRNKLKDIWKYEI